MQNGDYLDVKDNKKDDIKLFPTLASLSSPNSQSCLRNASVNDVSIIGLIVRTCESGNFSSNRISN